MFLLNSLQTGVDHRDSCSSRPLRENFLDLCFSYERIESYYSLSTDILVINTQNAELNTLSDAELLAIVRHRQWMLPLASRMLNDDHLAEDCVQETFISVASQVETFEGRASFATWIRQILVNNCLMKLRQQKRRSEVDINELQPQFDQYGLRLQSDSKPVQTPDALLQEQEMSAYVRRIIDTLPVDYRVVLLLRDIEELSTKEVSELLGCSQSVVKVRLHRARAALKKLLTPVLREGSQV